MMRQRPDGSWEDDAGNPVPSPANDVTSGAGGMGGSVDNGASMAGGMPGAANAPSYQRNQTPPAPESGGWLDSIVGADPTKQPKPANDVAAGGSSDAGQANVSTPGFAPPATPLYIPPTMQVTGGRTSVTGLDKASQKRIEAAETEAEGVDAKKVTNANAAGAVAKDDARDQKTIADQQYRDAQASQKQQDAVLADANKRYQDALAEKDAQYQKYKEMDLKSFFDGDQRGERRLWAAMTMALGGLAQGKMAAAAAMLGHDPSGVRNQGVDIVNDTINRDYERQKANILKQKTVLDEAGKRVDDIAAYKRDQLHDLELKTAAQKEATARQLASMMAARGVDRAEIGKNAAVNDLLSDAARRKMEVAKDLKRVVTSETERQLTGGQFFTPGQQAPDPLGIYVAGTKIGQAGDKEVAQKTNEKLASIRDARQAAVELSEDMQRGPVVPGTDRARHRQQLVDQITLGIVAATPGLKSDKDMELAREQAASSVDQAIGNSTRVNGLIKKLDSQTENLLGSVGLDGKRLAPVVTGEVQAQKRDLPMPNQRDLAVLVDRAKKGDAQAMQILVAMGYAPQAAKRRGR